MKATSRFRSAASAAALSAGLILSGAGISQFAGVTPAIAAVVSAVEVRGNVRVEDATIRNYVGATPGRNFTNADVDEALKRLFATGLFSDVRINRSGSRLIVEVSEYAIVNQVIFQGNRRVRDNQLSAAVQLGPRRPFSQALLEADLDAIRAAYGRVGRDDTVVSYEIVDLGENRVNVVYRIQEGGRTRIASINFVGNNAYSERRLRDVISTKRSHFMSWLTRNDIYDEDRLRADEEALRRFYYNRGYADFNVVSAFGDFDEARNEYTVTITIDEGERYTYGSIEIDSTIPGVDPQTLRSLLETREGRVYSAREVENSLIAVTERLAGMGYPFAEVTPRGDRDFTNRTISIVFTVDQGTRAYVERLEIRGNTRTRDYVIRREFDLVEGDAFNQVLIQRARRRLDALDFFESIEISTLPGSEPDFVVLLVEVTEKATGEFSVAAGYTTGGQDTGVQLEGAVSERNFLGRGQTIRVSVAGGRNSRDFQVSFTEPYFMGWRMSAGFDVYRRSRNTRKYGNEMIGGSVRLGLPITEALTAQVAYNLSRDSYSFRGDCLDGDGNPVANPQADPCNLSPILSNAILNQSPWIRSSVMGGLVYNTIDNMQNPREGIFATITTEFAGLGGHARFVKVSGRASYYHLISDEYDIVGLVSGGGGHVAGIGSGGLRVFDLFQSSDRIIRGFEYNGIGPVDSGTGDHLGGTTYFHASAEAQFPLPLVPQDFGLKGAVFADAATLYGNPFPTSGTGMQWRASVGVGLLWASPFGPLRIDYAVPVMKEATDRVQNFNFGISTRF